ncbi:MAG: hypothetical protein M9949_12055 [Candidatus Kapabacteria bacterium]|nr:hypothetical protein [Candidatus Kapabacteria bacterium]
MKWILYIAIMMMVISCKVNHHSQKNDSVLDKPRVDKIIFLNLNFSYDSLLMSTKAELIDYKIVEGKLKSEFTSFVNFEGTALRIAFYDDSANLLKSIIINNPLFQNAEHFVESGEISRTFVRLPETEFSLRTQLPNTCSFITVSEAGDTDQINGNILLKIAVGD